VERFDLHDLNYVPQSKIAKFLLPQRDGSYGRRLDDATIAGESV
jgi:hypothetical protein